MHHAVDDDVVNELVAAHHFRRNVRARQRSADDRVGARVLERRFRVDLQAELARAEQLADRNAGAARFDPDFALDEFEFREWTRKSLGAEAEEA